MKNISKFLPAAMFLSVVVVILGGCCLFGGFLKNEVAIFWDTALLQNVTAITSDGFDKQTPKISPDGKQLLYNEFTQNQWNIILLKNVTMPAKSPLIKGNSYFPAWYSNNNNYLYVSQEGGGHRIMRAALTGGGRTYVTRNSVGVGDHAPSVHGNDILFHTKMNAGDKEYQIIRMKDNGTEITYLGEGSYPSWHPTKSKFVFIREGNINEMDIVSGQVTEIFSDPYYNCAFPSFSGDGRYILFQKGAERKLATLKETMGGGLGSITKTFTTTRWQIFIMRADGTSLTALTVTDVDAYHPSMDANGFVYFVSTAKKKPEIYRAKVTLD